MVISGPWRRRAAQCKKAQQLCTPYETFSCFDLCSLARQTDLPAVCLSATSLRLDVDVGTCLHANRPHICTSHTNHLRMRQKNNSKRNADHDVQHKNGMCCTFPTSALLSCRFLTCIIVLEPPLTLSRQWCQGLPRLCGGTLPGTCADIK